MGGAWFFERVEYNVLTPKLTSRLKYYCFSHCRDSTVQKCLLLTNHGAGQYL